jgi:hypothetical protein
MKPYYPGNLGGNDRRYNRNQNTYDTGLTNKGPGMYRRNGTYRKKSGPDTDAILSEGITAIKDYLKEITDLQKRLVGSQEQIARAQEAHAEAMQQIAGCVMQLLGKSADAAPAPVTEEEPTRAAEPVQDNPSEKFPRKHPRRYPRRKIRLKKMQHLNRSPRVPWWKRHLRSSRK